MNIKSITYQIKVLAHCTIRIINKAMKDIMLACNKSQYIRMYYTFLFSQIKFEPLIWLKSIEYNTEASLHYKTCLNLHVLRGALDNFSLIPRSFFFQKSLYFYSVRCVYLCSILRDLFYAKTNLFKSIEHKKLYSPKWKCGLKFEKVTASFM